MGFRRFSPVPLPRFDSVESFAAVRGLLLNSIFQIINMYHICYLKHLIVRASLVNSFKELPSKGLLKS